MLPAILLFLMSSDFDTEQMRSNRLLTLQGDSVKSKIIMLMNVSATQGQSLRFSPLNTLIHIKYGLSHTVAARTVALQLCVWPLEIDFTRHVIMTVIVWYEGVKYFSKTVLNSDEASTLVYDCFWNEFVKLTNGDRNLWVTVCFQLQLLQLLT